MIFICSLIFLFLIKIRFPKGVSISEILKKILLRWYSMGNDSFLKGRYYCDGVRWEMTAFWREDIFAMIFDGKWQFFLWEKVFERMIIDGKWQFFDRKIFDAMIFNGKWQFIDGEDSWKDDIWYELAVLKAAIACKMKTIFSTAGSPERGLTVSALLSWNRWMDYSTCSSQYQDVPIKQYEAIGKRKS